MSSSPKPLKKAVSFNLSPSDQAPVETTPQDENGDISTLSTASTFSQLSLDPRLHRAVTRMKWHAPTPVQSAVIPAALAGRDVMVSAPTGSGKTAAYAVPLLQLLCRTSVPSSTASAVRAVVLVPTSELVHQTLTVLKSLSRFMDGLRITSVAAKRQKNTEKHSTFSLALRSDVVVGTPAAMATLRTSDNSNPLRAVEFVVVDEADLVLSYGYEKDAREVLSKIPTSAQSLLLSATLEAEGMDAFKKVILRRPLTVKITAEDGNQNEMESKASHYFSSLQHAKDRYLVTFAMLRLGVVSGKVLIFVNHINSAFKLKLFLDQFKVRSAILNSELPANSRIHCVEQFNAGVFDILIASDESEQGEKSDSKTSRNSGKSRRRPTKDEEFGLARGVDFKGVAAVLNFDSPLTVSSYTHRAGRTARGGESGVVLTLANGDKEAKKVMEMGREIGEHIGPLAFRMEQVEAFRYRVEDCLRLVTDAAVAGARLADVRRELVNAETLKDYFEENPNDLEALQHNMRLAKNIPEHLGHIPSYLIPAELRDSSMKAPGIRPRKRHSGTKRRRVEANAGTKKDPLKGFSVSGSSKERFREKHGIKKKAKKSPGQARSRKK